MSYKYKIVADNPLGYWDLSNVVSGSNYDITTSSNHALVSNNVIFSTPPLILNSGSVAKISSPTASIRINNKYNALNLNAQNNTYSLEFWLSFNNIFNGNGYETNNTASGYFNNNQLDIIKTINTSTGSTISKIFYDYNSNTIRYSFPGAKNNDAYYYLKNLDSPFHIVATYQNGKINLIVNNDQGFTSFVYDRTLMNTASLSSMVQFLIDGSSLNTNSSASANFLISNLAIYNYQPTQSMINNHLIWANYQDDPVSFSNLNQNINYFDFIHPNENFLYYKKYNGFALKDYREEYKTQIDENGIGLMDIDPMIFISSSTGTYSINSSSGIVCTASTDYVSLQDFGKYIKNNFSVLMQTSSSVTASNQYLFSISGVNGINTLFLQKNPPSSSGYYLYYYDEVNKTSTLFASIVNNSSTASGKENIGLSYDGANIYLYASTSSITNYVSNLSFSTNSNLAIGTNLANSSASLSSRNTIFYSNLGVFDYAVTDYSTACSSFAVNKMLLAPLTSSLTVNQYAYVIYEYPIETIKRNPAGSYINWSTPDNIKATVSYDGGISWKPIYWNSTLTDYDNTVFQQNILVKFEFYQKYNDVQPLRLNNLEFGIYSDYPFRSDFTNYVLIPRSASNYNTHSLKNVNNKIIFRPENAGITFKSNSSSNTLGYATASSSSTTSYGLDFWLKIDDLQSSKTSSNIYILNTSSYSLYYTASNPVLQWASATPMFVYVNGASISRASYPLLRNEYYHIGISSSSPVSGNININGGVSNSGSYNANATYAHLAIWKTIPSPSDIQNRYNLFVSNVIQTASTQDNTLFLRTNNYYDSASAYVIG